MLRTIRDAFLKDQKVICRVDFNVPINNGIIEDDTRIIRSLPTINYILDQGGYLILISHLGRPKSPDPKYSLEPIAKYLRDKLEKEVRFSPETIGPIAQKIVSEMGKSSYRVVLLENTRFHLGETKNDISLAQSLANLGDLFVLDAFGSAHRSHSSVVGITNYLPSYAGLLLETEYDKIKNVIENPENPSLAIIGGAKISSKLAVLRNFIDKVSDIIIGGGMAFTFLRACDIEVGKSIVEESLISVAKSLLKLAETNGVNIHLPIDVRIGISLDNPLLEDNIAISVPIDAIPRDKMALDIGPQTEILFSKIISQSNTIIWNGPMGVFEDELYRLGSDKIARAVINRNVTTVIGGGDTIYALKNTGINNIPENIYISTGGGASLELMSGKILPGIQCLQG